jgi:hypothetical protein
VGWDGDLGHVDPATQQTLNLVLCGNLDRNRLPSAAPRALGLGFAVGK